MPSTSDKVFDALNVRPRGTVPVSVTEVVHIGGCR